MAFFSFKGVNFHYSEQGKGPVVIFLHGHLENRYMWKPVLEQIPLTFRCICLDLPGHGDSGNLGYIHTMEEMSEVVRPIIEKGMDLVIGSRALGNMEKGAMMPQQIFGNWLATNLIRLFYRYHFTDLGPFRAIKWQKLLAIEMQDQDFGWTVEMQVKAAKHKLKSTERAVTYRKRIGVSKVSGTIRGTILAGHKILWTIFKLL